MIDQSAAHRQTDSHTLNGCIISAIHFVHLAEIINHSVSFLIMVILAVSGFHSSLFVIAISSVLWASGTASYQ